MPRSFAKTPSSCTTCEVTEVQVRPFQTSRIVLGLTPYMLASRVLVLFFVFTRNDLDEEGPNSAK